MTTADELKTYKRHNKTQFGLTNLQWTLAGAVASSSQPYHSQSDAVHTVQPLDVIFLKRSRIACVICANEYAMDDAGQQRLRDAGIEFFHYGTLDSQAPSPASLRAAAEKIEAVRNKGYATLVYCGGGQGRTGAFIATWALKEYLNSEGPVAIFSMCKRDNLRAKYGVEEYAQAQAVRIAALGNNFYPFAVPATAPTNNTGTPSGLSVSNLS